MKNRKKTCENCFRYPHCLINTFRKVVCARWLPEGNYTCKHCIRFKKACPHNSELIDCTCNRFERKKIKKSRKVNPYTRKKPIKKTKRPKNKKDSLKDRLREKVFQGYRLDYRFKSGQYEGCTIHETILRDVQYMHDLINNGRFEFKLHEDALAFYRMRYNEFREEKRREEKARRERERKRREEQKRNQKANFEDFFNSFFGGFGSDYDYKVPHRKVETELEKQKRFGAVLGLTGKVAKSEIKSFYKKQAVKWHPDKHNNSQESMEKMKDINVAWDFFKEKYALS